MTVIQSFRRHRALADLAVVIIGASLLGACSADHAPEAKAAPPSIPVVVAETARKTVPLRAQGVGNVESPSAVAVKARVDGQIVKVHFRDGARVTRGQILFEIDPRPALAQLSQAQAKLASDLAQQQHAADQERRYQDLLQKKFISPDGYAQYKANLDSASANVDADRAAVENARLQVEFATIRAPIEGRVGRIMIPEGNLVKANDSNPLVVINQISPIYVSFAVAEQYLPQIRTALAGGQSVVTISAQGADGTITRIDGKLAFADNTVDVATGTIKLRASVANQEATLWPGQFVTASVTLGESTDALVVPSVAVQVGPEGPFVFTVDAGLHAQMRKIVVDRTTDRETLVAKGLDVGEKVVVDGQSRLLPGSSVTIKSAGSGSR